MYSDYIKKLADEACDWARNDENNIQDLITLLIRLATVKGNNKFTEVLDSLRSELKDRI